MLIKKITLELYFKSSLKGYGLLNIFNINFGICKEGEVTKIGFIFCSLLFVFQLS
jgi:hypothetical protein